MLYSIGSVQLTRFEVSSSHFQVSRSPDKPWIDFFPSFGVRDHDFECAAHFAETLFQAFKSAAQLMPQGTQACFEYCHFGTEEVVAASVPTQLFPHTLFVVLGSKFLVFQAKVPANQPAPFFPVFRVLGFIRSERLPIQAVNSGFVFPRQPLLTL
jgi:hypothetical protein